MFLENCINKKCACHFVINMSQTYNECVQCKFYVLTFYVVCCPRKKRHIRWIKQGQELNLKYLHYFLHMNWTVNAKHLKLECGPMTNMMVALPNIGGALCSTPQSLATWLPCSNAAKTRNLLKLAGVPQTRQQISAVSGLKFTILCGHLEDISLLNKFFSDCRCVP